MPVTRNMAKMEIWLVILFLSRKKFSAKEMFVLSSSMKLGPALAGVLLQHQNSQVVNRKSEKPKTENQTKDTCLNACYFSYTVKTPQ